MKKSIPKKYQTETIFFLYRIHVNFLGPNTFDSMGIDYNMKLNLLHTGYLCSSIFPQVPSTRTVEKLNDILEKIEE